MQRNAIIVGGGIAGLAAAVYLARAGHSVTLFEKRRSLGGRAVTHVRHGFRFNLGPHSVYRTSAASTVYRELGVPVRGGLSRGTGVALCDGRRYRLPVSPLSILATEYLTLGGKIEALSLLVRLRRIDPSRYATMTTGDWLDATIRDARLRRAMESLIRVTTFTDDLDQSAAISIEQLKHAVRGAIYVDEGWQKLVDALHAHAVTAGVNFVTSAAVVGVVHDGETVRGIEIGGLQTDSTLNAVAGGLSDAIPGGTGTRISGDTVLLAVDPRAAAALVRDENITRSWLQLKKVTASCLDIALSKLPQRRTTFAIGIDKPVYLSVHSSHAQLGPRGGALVHLARYRSAGGEGDEDFETGGVEPAEYEREERELEAVLDELQPGWRELVVHRRFLPSMVVANALATADTSRPASATPLRGLYLAGDWVGERGALSDAALWSARTAARAIIDRVQ